MIALSVAVLWVVWAAASSGASGPVDATTSLPTTSPAASSTTAASGAGGPACPSGFAPGFLDICNPVESNPHENQPVATLSTVDSANQVTTIGLVIAEPDNRVAVRAVDWGDGEAWHAVESAWIPPVDPSSWDARWNAHLATCSTADIVEPPGMLGEPAAIGVSRMVSMTHRYAAPGTYRVTVLVGSGCNGTGSYPESVFWRSDTTLVFDVTA